MDRKRQTTQHFGQLHGLFFRSGHSLTEVALVAEKAGHHPDWHNVYNRVTIRLSTHEAGNTVTQKDRDLASAIDHILSRYTHQLL
ncbi:hypothetical protein MASR1M65_19050 [Saprospiraceae bacterium]